MPGPDPRSSQLRRARLAGAIVSLLFLVVLAVVVNGAKPRLASTNSKVIASPSAITIIGGEERCQGGEFVPRQAARLRLYTGTFGGRDVGEPLSISILDGAGSLEAGAQVAGSYPPGKLDVALPARDADAYPSQICLRNLGTQPMMFANNVGPIAHNGPGARPDGEVRVDLFRQGRESWFQLAPVMARRFALFKPPFVGPWTMWATLVLLGVLFGLGLALFLYSCSRSGEATAPKRRRSVWGLPLAGWACAGLAIANALAWAVVTPPLQVADEPGHMGYADHIARTGRLPPDDVKFRLAPYAAAEANQALLDYLPFSLEGKPSWSPHQERELRSRLETASSQSLAEDAQGAANYPALYYALEAVPARATAGATLLDRLFAMRLASTLLAGITVAFVYLFLRELLPGTPWAWVVGSLAVGFQPVFGNVSGGVNNDNLLFVASAAFLFLMARAFRSGLTPRLGVLMGGFVAAGALAKPSMLAVVPGAGLGLVLMAARAPRERRRQAMVGVVGAGAACVLVLLAWLVVDAVIFGRSPSATAAVAASGSQPMGARGQLSYLWQFFLPKLWFMKEAFPGYPRYGVWDIYIQGFIGRFGWFQYGFPVWANNLGLGVLAVLVALAGTTLVRSRTTLKRRRPEVACYTAMLAGLLLVMGVLGYRYRVTTGYNFEQPRYLFPVLGLYGAVVALAALSAGRRWAPALGVVLLGLAMAHSVFAILVTLGRYYA